ncbi:MAG: hypothetical protein JRH16_22890 [Deltaproteobacteria bacterium]|nr:hypothetical protein [Deltaproteobacteria bacterium]MBW2417753.1 hypothetical protein [Deltaproteobacteria bacterium]
MKIAIVSLAVFAVTLGAGFFGTSLGGGVARAVELECQGACEAKEATSPFAAFRAGLHRRLELLEDEFYRPYFELDAELKRLAGHPASWR